MKLKKLILEQLKAKNSLKVADIVAKTGFSRVYVSRAFKALREDGKVVLLGKANQARYVLADKKRVTAEKREILKFKKTYNNIHLSEDRVFDHIKKQTGILMGLPANLAAIIEYAFTEILNNAIDHSQSNTIDVSVAREDVIKFIINDHGIGVFKNIMQKRKLPDEMAAIQDLLKGKQTTLPEKHSGEGIFFTSKIADNLVIESFGKRLVFNNNLDDIFIEDKKEVKGTRVVFVIGLESKKKLENVFKEYAGDNFEFSKTRVDVRLYKMGHIYISRSQAKRITSGLDKFQHIVLDFKNIKTIGQAFADEIFRVWQQRHPEVKIEAINTNENIDFMINRAISW